MRLSGKVAIVTGAGYGIGRAGALRFAETGAKVVVAEYVPAGGAETAEMIRARGGEAVFVQTDVSRAEDCARAVQAAEEQFGGLHVLFANAGIMTNADVVSETEEQWDRLVGVNLKGIFLMAKYAVPAMLRSGGGSIINMSSVTGILGHGELAAYSAAKAAVAGLTRQMAVDYAGKGIRVNCVSPGTIDTPMLQRFLADVPDPEKARRSFISIHPIGRLGRPADVANAALFLASDEAGFVTGHNLVVDGGYSIKGSQPRD